MTRTEWLTDWEVLAIEESVRCSIEDGVLHPQHGAQLLDKLKKTSDIRISLRPQEGRFAA